MPYLANIEGLSECVGNAIQQHLATANIEWPIPNHLSHPILRIEAFLEDEGWNNMGKLRSKRVASRTVDLRDLVTPPSSQSPTTTIEPSVESLETAPSQESHSRLTDGQNPQNIQYEVNNGHVYEDETDSMRRKGIGGLRVCQTQLIEEDPSEHQRRMQSDNRNFPKRRKVVSEKFVFQPSTLDKLIVGIWEQIHGTLNLDPQAIFDQFQIQPAGGLEVQSRVNSAVPALNTSWRTEDSFSKMNAFCRRVTQASRVCRSIEIVVQARWTEIFEEQVRLRIASMSQRSATKHRKAVFMEACQDFGWSEKELRNKMAIWRGYKEVKDAAGWAALVFAGMGIYRFCKYRVGFDEAAMRRLQILRPRLEVAADTLHPHWRQILSIVGESSKLEFPGHPHDWVVFDDGTRPVPLKTTYLQMDPYFNFEHIEDSIVDPDTWGCDDPRWVPQSDAISRSPDVFVCAACGEHQSEDPQKNMCYCFPRLFGCVKRSPPPVQVFRTADGRNNGLLALTSFERGSAIGEFVGLVTKGMRHMDVMDGATSQASYQIWQGRQGNYTRFVNHSCKANAQFSQFNWLDTQRVVLVSKGIDAGTEITVDYSDRYWSGLDKACLCGESCCRYRRQYALD